MTRQNSVRSVFGLSAFAFGLVLWLGACSSSNEGTPGGNATGGAGGSNAGSGGAGGAAPSGSGGGSGGEINGSGGAVGSGGVDVDAGSDGAAGGAPGDAGGVDSNVMDPGTDGDGRFPMDRPATIPMEAQARLPGVMPGMMRNFNVPAAMGFAARSGSVYVPAGYMPGTPVAFTICHDGTSLQGSEHLTTVADNLAFQKKMPMMVFIFVPPVDRSREYDTVNDNFAHYLTTQALPAVEALGIKLTTDPDATGTCGHSSGGILAFTMAWFEPERYRRVLSFSGSYTMLQNPGGDMYNNLVRTTMPLKPIRIAMTAGTNDLLAPRWTMANETMGGALMAAGYHYRYILINGGTHDQASSLPWIVDLMTWLWRGYPASGPTR